MAAGLPTDAFFFAGFLPPKEVARRKRLAALAAVPARSSSTNRRTGSAPALADMAATLGDRPAAVARELTKAFETVRRGTLAVARRGVRRRAAPKGEIVVLVGPPSRGGAASRRRSTPCSSRLLETGTVRSAADEAAAATGLPRRDLYRRALALKDAADDAGD